MEIFHKKKYFKPQHRLNLIIGTMLIIVNNNIFDVIAKLSESRFHLIFIGNLRGLQASLAIILQIKDK